MSLRFALLALLSSRAMTGYDVSKQFSQSVAHVWHAPDSQIYPELRRMEQDGLVEVETVPWGPRGSKREYHLTPLGFQALRDWANAPLGIRRQRDPAYLKAAYLEWADPEPAREQMRAHLTYWQAHLELLESTRASLVDRSHPTLVRRLERYPEKDHERIVRFKVFAYDGLIDQARAEVAWARRGLALVDELSGDAVAAQ